MYYKVRLLASILYELSIALVKLPGLLFSGWLEPGLLSRRTLRTSSRPSKSRAIHNAEVKEVSRQVRQAYVAQKQIVLYRKPGHGHSARSAEYKRGHYGVDVAKLDSILAIDVAGQTTTVQAGISYEALCAKTLEHGLLPVVVPEFKRITVGGAIQGIGIESSSWKNGAVDEGVVEATLILGDGSITSSTEVPDLWSNVPGSNGSLALVVAATIRLRKAEEFVRIRYQLFVDLPDFLEALNTKDNIQTSPRWATQSLSFPLGPLHADIGLPLAFMTMTEQNLLIKQAAIMEDLEQGTEELIQEYHEDDSHLLALQQGLRVRRILMYPDGRLHREIRMGLNE
jgi:hypothetical protein